MPRARKLIWTDRAVVMGLLEFLRRQRQLHGPGTITIGPGRLFHRLFERGLITNPVPNPGARATAWRAAVWRAAPELLRHGVHVEPWLIRSQSGGPDRPGFLIWYGLEARLPKMRVRRPDHNRVFMADSRLTRGERRALERGLPIEPKVVYIDEEFAAPDD